MRWQYLLFDLDGTLTDPMLGITRSVQYALRHFGIDVEDLSTLCPLIGPPLRDSFREFYGMSAAQAEIATAKYREYYASKGIFENTVYKGIPKLLAELRVAGATLVMATSKPTLFAEKIARHFGFFDCFALISGSLPDGSRDAKADVIRYALSTLGITDTRQAVMIGDRRFDIEGAAITGLDSIAVEWGYAGEGELEAAKPGYTVTDIPELKKLLLG
ncbi:HAD family hydrolase [uncultured Alistipes sp.]|jgi:Predicted phosphatases|uniref:HAD family hydrolase n=1 Tax=uncultured Alistipes sp. TaxID=538949 RepID=UPI0025DF0D06|nr:HAD family hydrolase [uncultured Alistipes sp.]